MRRNIPNPLSPNHPNSSLPLLDEKTVILLEGTKCKIQINMESLIENCKVIHELLQDAVNGLRAGESARVITRKDLITLTSMFSKALLHCFRADCLASIINHSRLLVQMHVITSLILTSRFELTTVHLLYSIPLPKYLTQDTHEDLRKYLLKMHRKTQGCKWDEITWYEIDRRHKKNAEFN